MDSFVTHLINFDPLDDLIKLPMALYNIQQLIRTSNVVTDLTKDVKDKVELQGIESLLF